MKPQTIAVDVDDVCADFHGRLCAYFRDAWRTTGQGSPMHHGAYLPEISRTVLPEDIRGWDLTPYFGEQWREAVKWRHFYDEVKPVEGARLGVTKLWAAGHRVIYVTSCIKGTADAKQEWLLKWGFLTDANAERDFCSISDKSLVRADMLVDDALHNVEAFPGRAFLVNHWHNLGQHTTRLRVNNLLAFADLIAVQ